VTPGTEGTAVDETDDPRPWERPGSVRRDCEPHRAPALLLLAGAGVALVALGFLPAAMSTVSGSPTVARALCGLALLAAPPAVALGVGVVWAVNHDLAQMGVGDVDPAGKRLAEVAEALGGLGLTLGLGSGCFMVQTLWTTLF
jgi:hypothetical protein